MIRIGIDLGTTNSCVAFHDGKGVEVIDMADGRKTLPSVVSFMPDGEVIVGAGALDQLKKNTEFTFQHVKRLMGQPFRDNVNMGPQVAEGPDGGAWLKGRDKVYAPQEISALILKEMKRSAEERIGKKVDGAVIGVPAGFNPKQREATIEAGKLAGFKQVDIEEEPSAAAIAYGLDKDKFTTTAVFDMGGGTFDIAIMEVGRGHYKPLGSPLGHMRLGGINFDQEIANWVVEHHKDATGFDVSKKPFTMTLLQEEAEGSKRTLSQRSKAEGRVGFAYTDNAGKPQHIEYQITREELEDLTEHLVGEALEICTLCLEKAERTAGQVDAVILIGGMTRMPMVQEAVQAFFGRKPLKNINPDEAVARGCAIKGAIKDGRVAASHDEVTSFSFGIEAATGAFLPVIPRGSPVGTEKKIEIMTARDGQELMAIGIFQGDELMASENVKIVDYRHKVPAGHAGEAWLRLDWKIAPDGMPVVTLTDEIAGTEPVVITGGDP
jgi:molecular chaperone DnaK